MDYISATGFIAAALTVTGFLPQVIKAWKTKSTRDVSSLMFVILIAGNLFWIAYGVFIASSPVIVTNVLIFSLASMILILKLKYK